MPDGIFHHAIILAVKPFVSTTIDWINIFGNRIKVIIQKFIHHKYGPVRDIRGPFVNMIEKCFNNFLCSNNPFNIRMWLGKKSQQPRLSTRGSGEIQFMENGKFLFRVKDGNVAECGLISLHSNGEW